jgi:hypothetical protein
MPPPSLLAPPVALLEMLQPWKLSPPVKENTPPPLLASVPEVVFPVMVQVVKV